MVPSWCASPVSCCLSLIVLTWVPLTQCLSSPRLPWSSSLIFYAHVLSSRVLVHVSFFFLFSNSLLGEIENLSLGPTSSMLFWSTLVMTLNTIQFVMFESCGVYVSPVGCQFPSGAFCSCKALCSSPSLIMCLSSISTWWLWSSSV